VEVEGDLATASVRLDNDVPSCNSVHTLYGSVGEMSNSAFAWRVDSTVDLASSTGVKASSSESSLEYIDSALRVIMAIGPEFEPFLLFHAMDVRLLMLPLSS
jgi:hypothetical protein